MTRVFPRGAALLAAAALSLSLSAPSLGQRGGGPDGPIPAPLLAKLNLSAEQQARVKAAVDAYQAEMRKLDKLTTREERGEAAGKAAQTYRAALQAALAPEQLQQLQASLEEARRLGPFWTQLVLLDLSDEQKTKIKAIAARYEDEFQKLRASAQEAGAREALRAKFTELQGKMADEVRAVLTPQQQKQFEAGGRRGGGLAGGVPPQWLARLNLTADQKPRIDAAVAAYRAEMEKAQALPREERGAVLGKAAEVYAASLREILTADQVKQLQAMMEEAAALGPIGIPVLSLDLSEAQRTRLKEIAAKYQPEFAKLRALAAQTENPREALRPQYEELNRKITEEVRAVLTPEQQKQLDGSRGRS
jgi:Spy/CpxP family protein refolding chaperone